MKSVVPERLKRIDVAFPSEEDKGRIPGAVVLVARNGSVAYLKAFGFQDRERQLGMKTDAIFRIASLTKPITSVAMMILVEHQCLGGQSEIAPQNRTFVRATKIAQRLQGAREEPSSTTTLKAKACSARFPLRREKQR